MNSKFAPMVEDIWQILSRVPKSRVMWALLLCDMALLLLHVSVTGIFTVRNAPESANWARIDMDHSVSEAYEYLLFASASAALLVSAFVTKRFNMVPFAAIFIMLLCDDMLEGHERLSGFILPGHQNYGEVLFFILLFVAAAILTLIGWYRANAQERSYMAVLWLGILVLSGFGVGVDALHVKSWEWFISAERWIGLVEDFGELLSISFIAATCYSLAGSSIAANRALRQKPHTGVAPKYSGVTAA